MFEQAKWIWNQQSRGTDCYTEFIMSKEFGVQDAVQLRLSVDSNYAVYVNGVFVNSGQYADYPHYKVYDTVDLSDYIISGENHIAIVVWYYGIDSFTYYKAEPGLRFEIEQNGTVVLWSNENIQSRKSRRYISGKNQLITIMLGLNFHVDMREKDDWMLGKNSEGFEASVVKEDMPEQLFPREIKKQIIKAPVLAVCTHQGSFSYVSNDETDGHRMQHANLSFSRIAEMGKENDGVLHLARQSGEGIYFIIDLQSEYAGYLEFDLEVPEDCCMEIGWGEHLIDGRCRTSIGKRNFSVSVILKAGRNTYMNPFRRFGCRYIQFFLHTTDVTVHYAGLRPVEYPVKRKEYKTGNLLRDTIYAVCQETLIHCMHEHYEDCPWREQALYNMDSRNQMLCGYYAFGEYEFPRASLRLMSRAIREDNMFPICFPTGNRMCIPSFTITYAIQLAEYYRYSKDKETIEYCFEAAKRIVDGVMERIDETGLIPNYDVNREFWNFYEWQPYLDGSFYQEEAYDMCLNAMFSYVLDYFMELCNIMEIDTKSYQQAKEQLNNYIVEAFYDDKEHLFHICKGPQLRKYSVLANAYAYLCGAAEELNTERMLQVIRDNGSEGGTVIPVTLSMNAFRYDALLKADRECYKNYILEEIDNKYLKMLREGATTFWETELGASDFDDAGSLCHGWSALPIYYYETLI